MSQKLERQTRKYNFAWLCGLTVIGGLAIYKKTIFRRLGQPYPVWLSTLDGWMNLAFGTSLLYPVPRDGSGVFASRSRNGRKSVKE